MAKDRFFFKKEYYEALKPLSAKQKSNIIFAVLEHEFNDRPIELTGIERALAILIAFRIDGVRKQ